MSLSQASKAKIVTGSRQSQTTGAAQELENTVARFQASLTDDDRIKLQKMKGIQYDTRSIITFTAELDGADQRRRGKSIATRLATLLQIIQQFVPVVDTFIQSNPDLAALIWGAMRVTFLSEIRTYVDDIKFKAEDVAQEIQLAKAKSDYHEQQLQGKERTEAASSRKQFLALMSRSRSDIRQIKEQGKKQEEPFNNARSKRHLGTAEWIFEMDEYKEWYTSDTSGVLHVTGKIGSGKSILASHVVEYLYQQRGANVFISYFFLRFDDVASLKCDMIIRSLVHQILCTVPMDAIGILLASDIMNCLEQISPQQSNVGSLEKLFFKLLTLCKDWFIVLDGVDECHPSEEDQLCKFLSSVSTKTPESHNVKIWISGRETTQVLVDRSFSSVARLVAGSSHTSSDIKVYAEEVLQSKASSMQLVVRDANIIDEIIQIIIAKGEGMFLWVFFTIEDLCSCKSDKDIREALLDIPMDLAAIFNRALGRIVQQRHQTIAQNVFKLSAAALRPLTLPELSEALSLKPGQNRLNPDGLINGIERVGFWCENLIHIEKTDNTVQFSHQSIREFFLRPGAYPFHDFHFELEDADSYIAKICLTYLNLDDFETSLVKKDDPGLRVNFEMPVSSIAGQAIQTAARGGIGNRMVRWINLKSASNASIGQCSIPVRTSYYTRDSIISTNRPFWNYAANNWCFHDAKLSCKHEPKVWEYLGTVLEEPQLNLNTPWMDIEWRSAFIAKRQPVHDYDDIWNGKREWPWQLLKYMQDKTDLWANLAFAVLFAHDTNHTLACQALYNLGRFINEKPQYIAPLLEVCLDFNAEHIYCPNQCVQTAFGILDKPSQLYVLASYIAFGAKSWPALQRSRPSSRTKSNFLESSIVEDLSILLENGYEAREQPLMRAAAIMSLYKTGALTLELLSIASRTEPQVLFESKTPTGKSILEIAIETKQPSGMSASLIQSFSRHGGWLDLGSTGNVS
ncbi:Nacht domain-containing protein [Fusarium mundagurra]|uniref:Nacht domain-containing protein n=1 Tax=Fusarium mundagurra TaxID=1567541 RepID=A0A8H5Y245_9HYPO|nr:Nacht domain-containing protein [Fusarium mundagurra]